MDNVDYDKPPPPEYRCSGCEVHGVKLWRYSHSSHVELKCAACAAKESGVDPTTIDDLGTRISRISGNRTDQIGNHIPAIPCEDPTGGSYWGYNSLPADAVEWWRDLPVKHELPMKKAPPVIKFLTDVVKNRGLYSQRTKLHQIEAEHAKKVVELTEEKVDLSQKLDLALDKIKRLEAKLADHEEAPCCACGQDQADLYLCSGCYEDKEGSWKKLVQERDKAIAAQGSTQQILNECRSALGGFHTGKDEFTPKHIAKVVEQRDGLAKTVTELRKLGETDETV